ncbi:MAG TPA: DHA2 family efflux MFS transporter permease subunit [Solirubrobacterales bacterium]|nr:DHA2 family efflux MFS transporter permease subunit [Solirubrobacterales bacterium]
MSSSAADPIEPYVWRITGVVILGMIMSILDTTIVNVALDDLSRELHSTIAQIQWVATGYLLSLAAVIPLTGWAARRFGAKRVYIGSVVLFTLGSALCGLAESSTSLILFRVLQGVGGGMIMPVAQMIMAEVAGPKRMGQVMGVVAMPAMLAPILGPVVGGLILQHYDWSWIFFVNVPVGIVAIALGLVMLPESELGEAGELDLPGLALLVTSMPLIVYGLAEIGTKESFTAPTVVWPIAIGAVLSVAFVWHALRARRPLLDVRLYKDKIFGAASLTTFGLGAALFGAMILVPLYYQQVRGESVVVTGLLVGPQGLGMLFTAPFTARLTERFGGGRVAVVGVSLLTLSSLPLAFIGADTSILFLSLVLLLRGVGIGLSFMPTMTVAYASLRTDQLSDATPQMNVLQRLGGAIGTALLAVVLQRASAGASTPAELAGAFGTAYWWSLGLAAASLIPCVVLLRAEGVRHLRGGPEKRAEEEIAEAAVEPLGA